MATLIDNLFMTKKQSILPIPLSRYEYFFRFIDFDNVKYCTKNPLTVRNYQLRKDYFIKKALKV